MDPSLYSQTIINPIALIFSIFMCVLVLTLKKENIIIPAILVACLITGMQRISIFSIDFTMLRLITIIGLLRIFVRGEHASMSINNIDKLMIYYTCAKTIIYIIQWASFSAVIYTMGEALDFLGCYFLVRLVLSDLNGIDITIKTLILVSVPIAILMLYEHFSGGRNLFSAFGGVPELSDIRNGRLRAQGAFAHSIMAGTFGAMLFPLSWGIWHRKKKKIAVLGFLSSVIITFASSSSGPIVTLGVGMLGIFLWLFRNYTKNIVQLFFLILIVLQFVMNAPIWHLIARIDLVGGSTGFHRFLLIDAAIQNLSSWLIFGIKATGVWGRGLEDITNQYILEGVRGGILTLFFFILILTKCFQLVGSTRAKFMDDPDQQKYVWSLGVLLFAHAVSFVSVSYFGTLIFFYYMLIAMISSLNNISTITATGKINSVK